MVDDNEQLRKDFSGDDTNALAEDFSAVVHPLPSPNALLGDSPTMVHRLDLKVERLPHYKGLPPLKQATIGSVGVDLYAATNDVLLLNSIGATVVVPTGIRIELPHGFEAQIRPRSGLAANEGLTVLNSPGTIDSDYRGEIKVILTKLTTGKFRVERGMRIAQMVIAPVVFPTIVYVDEVDETDRGAAGFGSSGVKL